MWQLIFRLPLAIPVLLVLAWWLVRRLDLSARKHGALLAVIPIPFVVSWSVSLLFGVQPGSTEGLAHVHWASWLSNGLLLMALILPIAVMIGARRLWAVTLCLGLADLFATLPATILMTMVVTGEYV